MFFPHNIHKLPPMIGYWVLTSVMVRHRLLKFFDFWFTPRNSLPPPRSSLLLVHLEYTCTLHEIVVINAMRGFFWRCRLLVVMLVWSSWPKESLRVVAKCAQERLLVRAVNYVVWVTQYYSWTAIPWLLHKALYEVGHEYLGWGS